MPKLMKARHAMAQVVPRFSNMISPICANAAAIVKEGIKNAAIAEAATLG